MQEKLKFSVGYQLPDLYRTVDIVAEYAEHINEVFFPWLNASSGRGICISSAAEQQEMEEELLVMSRNGIKMNVLYNANCYGEKAISRELEQQICDSIDYLLKSIGLDSLTTTSLFIASVVKREYPDIEVKASVNMGIGSIQAMEYVSDYFDGFYLKRELNRYPEEIKLIRQWCGNNGKKLYMLANSGCLLDCSAHAFHDNLVSHEHNLHRQENSWQGFRGICWKYYAKNNSVESFLEHSSWIRPEDIDLYGELVDGVKLATRVHLDPRKVVEAYAQRRYSGNVLGLCEPDFSSLQYIENETVSDYIKN